MAASGTLVTRKYNNFKGLDTREGEISLNRSPDSLNMFRNYKTSNLLETRPDIELLTKFDSSVFGLFFYEVGLTKQLIVHSGTKLYKLIKTAKGKNDNINEVNISHDSFTATMSDSTYTWRFDGFIDGIGAVDKLLLHFATVNSKKCLYITKYSITLNTSAEEYLMAYFEADSNDTYTYEEDIDLVPSSIKTGLKLTKYGQTGISWRHSNNLTPRDVPAGTLPNILSTYVKTQLTFTGFSGMKPAKSYFFVYNNILYIKDGINYLQYDGTTLSEVVGYIPTTSISRRAEAGGTIYEDVNMLSPYRINTFCADGSSTDYHLDSQNIDSVQYVKVNGTALTPITDYTINTTTGVVTFLTAPTEPDTDGQDNVEICYGKEVSGYANRILHCTLLAVFDNRIFFSGNPDYPNVVWHSSLDAPDYVSDLDYYNEGLDLAKVKALVPGNNALWVFKEPSQANTTVFYHLPTIDAQYGKIYPSSHSSISTGCVGAGINFNDDICFFSDRGMEGVSGDVTTEQVVAHRSTFVDSKLLKETNYERMILDEWEGYLLVCIDNKIYLADSRQVTPVNAAYEYDWYYWELPKDIKSTYVKDGVLYIGCVDGLYTLTNTTNDVNNYWTTPMDTFGYGNYQKITNKRGCIIECEGKSIDVSVKTNKDAMALIKTFTNVTDYIIARIKRKKFKDMQIKISSNKSMKLQSIMIESYIGAYVKR